MLLRVAQRLGGDAVELHVEGAQGEQRLYHGAQVGLAALGGDEVGVQAQVEQRAAGVYFLVDLGGGTHGGQRRGLVGADIGAHALAGGVAVLAAAGRGAQHAAHGDVVGNAHEGGGEGVAEHVLVLVHFVVVVVGHLGGDVVHIVVVVAVLGAVLRLGAQLLIALPVGLQGLDERIHGADLVLEHQLLHRGQRVGHDGEADAGDDGAHVVLRAALAEVLADLHAVLVAAREEGPRHHLLVQALGGEQTDDSVAAEVVELAEEGALHLFIGAELGGGLLVEAHHLAGDQRMALVEGVLQRGAEVEVGGGGPLARLAEMGHHAAAVVPVAGVVRLIAEVYQHLIADGVAVYGREAGALAHQMGDSVEELLRAVGVDADGEARLVALDLFGGLQGHVGHGVGGVLAVARAAADGQVLELVIAGKVVGGVGGDGPHPLGVLQPEGLDQLLGKVLGDGAFGQVGLVIGVHVLVEAAGVEGQRVFGEDGAYLHEPEELDGLIEALGGILRHAAAVFGDHAQFLGALGVGFLARHALGLVGVAVGVADDAAGGPERGLIEVALLLVLRVRHVELGDLLLGLPDEAAEALLEEHVLIVGGDLAHGLAPLGVAVDDAGVHADVLGVLRQAGQEGLLQALALPVGEDLLAHELALLVGHLIRVLRAAGEGVHLPVHPQPGELGREDAALAVLADGAHHQLAVKDVDGQLVAAVIERARALDADRQALGLLVGFGPEPGSLAGEGGLGVYIILADILDALGDHQKSLLSMCRQADVMPHHLCVILYSILTITRMPPPVNSHTGVGGKIFFPPGRYDAQKGIHGGRMSFWTFVLPAYFR